MDSNERVSRFLDRLSKTSTNTFERAHLVREVKQIFPEVNWSLQLVLAAERQEERDPEANSMRGLFRHLAPELLESMFPWKVESDRK